MVSKLSSGVLGSRARSELKECWQMRSRLMGERSGRANSVQNRMCGRGGVAGDATVTSRRGCTGSTGRRSLQKSGEWSTGPSTSSGEEDRKTQCLEAENKELRARIDAMEKKEGVQGGPEYPLKRRRGLGRCCEVTEVEDEAESRKKLDGQKKKMQKEPREVDRLSFVSKEMQESIKESLQHQLQEVEKRRHDLMLEHKAQKRSQKIQSIQDKRRNLQKDSISQQKRRCGSSKRRSGKRRSVTFSYRTKSIRIRCRMQKWWQSFRFCRREKKEEAAMLRRQVIAAWRPCGSNSSPWEQMELRPLHKSSKEKWEQHKGRCQEEKKDEGIVKMNKSKAEPISSWCYQRQAGSIKVHQRVVWSLIFLVFGVYQVKAEVQEDQAHKVIAREVHPDLQDGFPWMRKRMTMWEEWCV